MDTTGPEPLSRDQQDSWDAFKDAAKDVAAAVPGGEVDLKAAFAALKQVSERLDSQAFLNALHVPKDAGEHEAGLRRILARIPDGWGRWISCGKGWFSLLVELDEALAAIDPNYEVHQVKEKYAGLRYYYGPSAGVSKADYERMERLVDAAEARAEATCETCGAPGKSMMTRARSPWYKTVCSEHAEEGGYISKEEWDSFCEWWEENERPKLEARQRQSFIDQRAGKRVLIAARDFTLPVSTATAATPAGIANLIKEMAPKDGWYEIWVGNDDLGDAALDAVKELYADHAQEQATKEPDGPFGSRIIRRPEGSPTIVQVEHRDTRDVLKTGVSVMSYPQSYYSSK